jgi:hypothetical protein
MADQGIWFKLHCSALDDPDLDNLDMADFGRWAKLGAYVKRQGSGGRLLITPPARALCAMLQVAGWMALLECLRRLPKVHVEESAKCNGQGETGLIVTFENWLKYQGDFSSPRVAKFREMKRSKRRGEVEETRSRGEKKPPPPSPPVIFQIPARIQEALRRAPILGAVSRLQTPTFWQAQVRANAGVNFGEEILKAEAWLATNPTRGPKKDLARFLHNWLARAERPPDTEE